MGLSTLNRTYLALDILTICPCVLLSYLLMYSLTNSCREVRCGTCLPDVIYDMLLEVVLGPVEFKLVCAHPLSDEVRQRYQDRGI
jgi:hypothetical protein